MMASGRFEESTKVFLTALQHCAPYHDDSSKAPLQTGQMKLLKFSTTEAFSHYPRPPSFEIFNRCFLIFPEACDDYSCCNTEESADLLAATLIYNYALAYHLWGHHQTLQQGYFFQKAHGLYQFASDILQTLRITEQRTQLGLALCNNIAAISLEMFDFDAFTACQELILVLLSFDEHFYDTFFMENFAVNIAAQKWPAPAA